MRFLWISLRKDWSRVRGDPFSLGTAIAIPLVLAVLMSLIFGRSPATPHGRLLIDDEDQSIASNLLTGAFNQDPLSKMMTVEKVGREEGQAQIGRGDASAFLIIPKGLQQAFLQNSPCQLQLLTNPSQRILPQIAQESISIMTDAAFYLQRAAGDQLRALDASSSTADMVSRLGASVNLAMTTWNKYLNPRLIDLDTEVVREQRQTLSFAATFLPSMIFMGLLFISSSLAGDIWKERLIGALRRLAASPVPLGVFLASRLVFVAAVYAIVAVVGLVAARQIAGMSVPNLPAAVLWMVFVGAAFYLLFLWISLIASTARAANVLANLLIFPLSLIGGCLFPFEWMPDWMVRIGKFTPNGWAIVEFKAILAGSAAASQLAIAVAALVAVSAVAFVLALRRMRSGFVV